MESKSKNRNGRSGIELSRRCIEELASRTAELVCDEIDARTAAGKGANMVGMIGTRDAAKLLGISVCTLRRRVMDFPHVVIRGRYYFSPEELSAMADGARKEVAL